jgi:RNA recognition motif-containing protein
VYLPTDRVTQRPRGFAFVQFATEDEAAAAIRLFEGRELDGRRLKVNPAEARPPAGQGPRPVPAPPPPDFRTFGDSLPPRGKPFKAKGSRRNLRARKRSL